MFLKQNFHAKRKNNPKLVYPGIRYAHKKKLNFLCKIFFSKFNLRLKKKQKILVQFKITWGNFKIFLLPLKNASHTIPIYRNCMISIFLTKKFNVYLVQYTELLKQENCSSKYR